MLRLGIAVVGCVAALSAQNISGSLFDGLRWRLIGPFRGGRAVAATGIPGDTNTFYLGAVNGVADSADRTPPSLAYALYEKASESVASLLANWDALKNGKLAELNRELREKGLKPIDFKGDVP